MKNSPKKPFPPATSLAAMQPGGHPAWNNVDNPCRLNSTHLLHQACSCTGFKTCLSFLTNPLTSGASYVLEREITYKWMREKTARKGSMRVNGTRERTSRRRLPCSNTPAHRRKSVTGYHVSYNRAKNGLSSVETDDIDNRTQVNLIGGSRP